jgi:hypothetical protein
LRVSLFIVALLTFSCLSSFIILAQPLGRCDPSGPPLEGIDVEGAHIVSEGAYFRFWIFNNNSFPIQVQMQGQSERRDVPPYGSINYDVIAPNVFGVYEQVNYQFAVTGQSNASLVNFLVIVINSFFVQIFSPLTTILLITIIVVIIAVVIVIIRRRRSPERT